MSSSQIPAAPDRVTDVTPDLLEAWLKAGDTVLIDVREDFEQAEERIDGAIPHPLSTFDAHALRQRVGDGRAVFQCRSGKRSLDAAQRYQHVGMAAFHLAGGIEAWKSSGRPVVRPVGGPRLPIMRQVQVAAGLMVALGVLLGLTISPWFLAVPAFVGCGLVFAGVSGWCGLAMLLGAMPWNKRSGTPTGASSTSIEAGTQ